MDDPVLEPVTNFTEGIFIDYRWFDCKNITPRYGMRSRRAYSIR